MLSRGGSGGGASDAVAGGGLQVSVELHSMRSDSKPDGSSGFLANPMSSDDDNKA